MKVLTSEFKCEIERITKLSSKLNENTSKKILQMMKDHIHEIKELFEEDNKHYQIETADLIVLSFELLLLHTESIDSIFTKCLPRFYKKLNEKNKQ